ncbi:MAG: M23 family metallopeptidase [Leptospiraceae bacterium]|nr:M23 family metallopeptidase [Leptospiraceae bacterium]
MEEIPKSSPSEPSSRPARDLRKSAAPTARSGRTIRMVGRPIPAPVRPSFRSVFPSRQLMDNIRRSRFARVAGTLTLVCFATFGIMASMDSSADRLTIDAARSAMDQRARYLLQLSAQQEELHDILEARPSSIFSVLFEPSHSSRDASALLASRISANERYLSDGLGMLQSIPHKWPVLKRVHLINSGYGTRHSPFKRRTEYHGGLDLKARKGDSVVATAEGYVFRVGPHGGFGQMVHLIHPTGYETIYAHLSEISVEKGQTVQPGDILGKAGDSGLATGPHLHYEVRLDGKRQDPIRYLIP